MIFSLASVAFGSRSVAQDLWLKICSLAFLAQGQRKRFIMGGIIPGGIIYSSRLKKWCVRESLVFKNLYKNRLGKQECGGVWSIRCKPTTCHRVCF